MSQKEFSAPGRVEIGGNHTDHQCGPVLTAAINLETKGVAALNGTDNVHIMSEGFDDVEVDLNDLDMHEEEKDTAAALVRGIAAWFRNKGHVISGFDAKTSTNIPIGKGLSSSAAFEILIGRIIAGLFGIDVSPLDLALAGRFAENTYFGKPSGLMDQAASSFGGCMMIDFRDPGNPVVTPVRADLTGYSMCLVAADDSHADMTADYAAIYDEMVSVAKHFGKNVLMEVSPDAFYASVGDLRYLGDRPILRAIHFFEESRRVGEQCEALMKGDTLAFLRLVSESGRSSFTCLQNIYSSGNVNKQGLSLALALAGQTLGDEGAYRVHGGGFAGTIMAFVPDHLKDSFTARMSAVFGESCCYFLTIR
jgi:galactokinase